MKTLWTDIREGWRAMQYHYAGRGAVLHVVALAVRCLLWWVMGCILLFMAYGGLLLLHLGQKPEQVASTLPGLLPVVHEVVVRWQWQCITVLSWVLPLFCLGMTLVRFIPGRTANAERTRIPPTPASLIFLLHSGFGMRKPQRHPLASLSFPEQAQHIQDNCTTFIMLNQPARPFSLSDGPQRGHTIVVGRTGACKTFVLNRILQELNNEPRT